MTEVLHGKCQCRLLYKVTAQVAGDDAAAACTKGGKVSSGNFQLGVGLQSQYEDGGTGQGGRLPAG